MSEHKESLSALMDGEINGLELRRLLKQVEQNPELALQWQRYQLSTALLKRESASLSGRELSVRVMAAISDNNTENIVQETKGLVGGVSGMYRSLASMAVAASVTAAIILGPGWFTGDSVGPQVQPNIVKDVQSVTRNGFAQSVTYGSRPVAPTYHGSMLANDADMIRSPVSMQRYIDQHLSLMDERPLQWGLSWLPDGYQNIRHQATQAGEVMVFSNGQKAFSVSVEQLGQQSLAEGVTDAGDFIALGLRSDDQFVTVVGDMPIMVAERIASSVISGR